MKLKVLMITPGVDENEDILGFTASWIRALAKRVDMLYVITPFFNPDTPLPENAIMYGLNEKPNKLTRYLYLSRVMIRLLSKRQVDVIFCHIGPNSVLWAAPWAKLFRVPIVTWYTHREVSWRLRIAHLLTNKVVTASEESYNIKSNKVIITGHGIDTDKFKPVINSGKGGGKKSILSLGRISPIKDYETLIRTASILVSEKDMRNTEFLIVGGVSTASQEEYFQRLKSMIGELKLEDYVRFAGSALYSEVVDFYQACDMHVNLCPTGGVDKAVLEAMACGKPVIVCNESFKGDFGDYAKSLMFSEKDPNDLARKITHLIQLDEPSRNELCRAMRQIAKKEHSVDSLMDKLIKVFADSRR